MSKFENLNVCDIEAFVEVVNHCIGAHKVTWTARIEKIVICFDVEALFVTYNALVNGVVVGWYYTDIEGHGHCAGSINSEYITNLVRQRHM